MFCFQVLQAQVDNLLRGEGDMTAACTQTEETLAGEACAATLQAERELREKLVDLASLGLPCQPEENDQLDLLMETDGLRKSIHNLGTIVTTRCDGLHVEKCREACRMLTSLSTSSSSSVLWRAKVRPWVQV